VGQKDNDVMNKDTKKVVQVRKGTHGGQESWAAVPILVESREADSVRKYLVFVPNLSGRYQADLVLSVRNIVAEMDFWYEEVGIRVQVKILFVFSGEELVRDEINDHFPTRPSWEGRRGGVIGLNHHVREKTLPTPSHSVFD
jgi:hypothetical protein